MQFSDTALELAASPFSYSKLAIGRKCPFAFRKQFIEKLAPADVVENPAVLTGTTLHLIMEKVLKAFFQQEGAPTAEELFGKIKETAEKIAAESGLSALETAQVEFFYKPLEHMLGRILTFQKTHAYRPYVEMELAIDRHFNPVAFWSPEAFFRGKVDLILASDRGNTAVIDHKTGYKTLRGHEQQLWTYELLAFYALNPVLQKDHGISISNIRTGINFLADESIEWAPEYAGRFIATERKKWFVNWVNEICENAMQGTVSRGRHCNWCGYKSLCGSKVGTRKRRANTTAVLM